MGVSSTSLWFADVHTHAFPRGLDAAAQQQLAASEPTPNLTETATHPSGLDRAGLEGAFTHEPDDGASAVLVHDCRGDANARRRSNHWGSGEPRFGLEKIDACTHLGKNARITI